LVFGDLHVGKDLIRDAKGQYKWVNAHDRRAFKMLLKGIEVVKPDAVRCLGDFGELNSFSNWDLHKPRRLEGVRRVDDFNLIRQFRRQIETTARKANKKVELICHEGNHEFRIERYLDCNSADVGVIGFDISCRFSENGWRVIPYRVWDNRGKLFFNHHHPSVTGGMWHAKASVEKSHENTMYGHFHCFQRFSVPNIGSPKGGFAVGGLCNLNKSYVLGSATAWSHGFYIVYHFPNRTFRAVPVEIFNGQTVINGKHYKVN
jgi:metallophosphoesterase superfamily enzyme